MVRWRMQEEEEKGEKEVEGIEERKGYLGGLQEGKEGI